MFDASSRYTLRAGGTRDLDLECAAWAVRRLTALHVSQARGAVRRPVLDRRVS